MNVFDVLTLFGGLAMFLYGMRLMGDGLKESSSGALKVAMEHVTNNPIKAFLLGVAVTAIIQSSTATIVITSGLVAAGIISLRQSLGIIIGANVGTTVTGQIIRLLDLDSSAGGILQWFRPSTLAPLALIIGMVLIMGVRMKNSQTVGNIAIGFGILFSGLLNMTGAVNAVAETGVFETLFSGLGSNPILGYFTGAGVAFILQSSSATIGILQAFSQSGQLTFNAIYAVIVGIYLGDCVTTAIVCSIGAKADARRVGVVNILFNLSETVLVLVVVAILKQLGLLDSIWTKTVNSGIIANTNTIFNLSCAVCLFPMIGVYEKLANRIVKDAPVEENKHQENLEALNPVFFRTPAFALRSCYDLLLTMFYIAKKNLENAFTLLDHYDEEVFQSIQQEEEQIDILTDRLSDYLASLSSHLTAPEHITILNEYYKVVTEFERLGDHAVNIAESAKEKQENQITFSTMAMEELEVLKEIIWNILGYTEQAFKRRDIEAAYTIEPLEEVVDDMVDELRENHLTRMSKGECSVYAGTYFMDLLGNIERISDICSNVGLATITRVNPELANHTHDYAYHLHEGLDAKFNQEYHDFHELYFQKLNQAEGK